MTTDDIVTTVLLVAAAVAWFTWVRMVRRDWKKS